MTDRGGACAGMTDWGECAGMTDWDASRECLFLGYGNDGVGDYPTAAIIASISVRIGIDGAVPALVTDRAAVAQPKRAASTGDLPSPIATAKAPLKASPAPVVSTTFTL